MPRYPASRLDPMVTGPHETRTKIVATIGPSSRSPDVLGEMIRGGLDVARINFSHGTHDELRQMIADIRRTAEKLHATVAVLADLQGPKLRIGSLTQPIDLAEGDWIALTSESSDGSHRVIHVPHAELIAGASVGGRWLVDDGSIEITIREARPETVIAQILVGGRLSSHKGIHAPGATACVDALTAKDLEDARLAVACGVDYVGLSFVQSADDMQTLRSHLDGLPGGASVGILAKIEKREALQDLDRILAISDAVMVARGDLGLEIPPEEVPIRQKEIVHACNREGVPVIVATQMLESMIGSPRPTRAETSDVANAILDGADAVMLSGETAVGRYPVKAVAMMREISAMTERDVHGQTRMDGSETAKTSIADAVSEATARVASDVDARLIATVTTSGYTARRVAKERPWQPIVALTPDEGIRRQLALVWGVAPLGMRPFSGADEMLAAAVDALVEAEYVERGDVVVLTAGLPIGGRGTTNLLKVHRIK